MKSIKGGNETYKRRKGNLLKKEERNPIKGGKESYKRRKRNLLKEERKFIKEGNETH
jgi:hypothetical protein